MEPVIFCVTVVNKNQQVFIFERKDSICLK